MKSADLKLKMCVAVTDGTSRYDRSIRNARQAEVVETRVLREPRYSWGSARADGVRIKLLDKPEPLAQKRRYDGRSKFQRADEGTVLVVAARDVWKPWSDFAGEKQAEVAERAAEEAAEKAFDARTKEVEDKVVAITALKDLRFSPGRDFRDADGARVSLPLTTLEMILDAEPDA